MAVEVSQGVCDLCGAPSDASLQECNWLTCTFQHCEGGLYHQECLEKYLKSNKLEKNRKTGFKCPRGCGKGTRFDQACPGRIDKSHPIHPRNEDKKKTKLAAVVVEPQRPAKTVAPLVQNGKGGKTKEEAKADAGKDAKGATPNKAASGAKASAPAAAAAPTPVVALKSGRKEVSLLPPRPEAAVAKQKLAELAAQARREIGLPASATGSMSSSGSKGDLQGLAGATGPSKPPSSSAASAWGKPSAPLAEPPSISPQPPMMSQLPQLQQLLQQAASKKAAAAKTAAATSSASAPQPPKPAPAVPQPVLNPPTPVWPALGAAQTSAAALLASSSSQPGSSSKETVARPASPPSAWATQPATSSTPQQQPTQQQPSQQPQQQQPNVVAASRPPSGSGTAAASTPASTTAAAATAAVATATAAAAPVPSSSATPGTSGAAAAAAPAGPASSTGQGSAAASEPSSSDRNAVEAADATLASTATLPAAAPSAATASTSSRCPSQLVGAEFADEEAKEPKLTKAQKKNQKRTEKKKTPSQAEQQQGSSGEGDQEAAGSSRRVSESGINGPLPHPPSTSSASTRQTDAGAASVSGTGMHKRQESRGSDDPEQAHIAAAEDAAVMEELCINCIVGRKVLTLMTQLQRLGALEFVAAAAVQRYGSNLLAALEWLLVAGADAADAPAEAVLTAAADSTSAAESEVDVSEELQQLNDLQAAMGVPSELLHQCVLECNGDVQTAANTAMERMLAAPPGSGPAAGRASSGSGASPAARQGAGGMHQSASFYSASSLDPTAGGQDADSASLGRLRQPPMQQQLQQQQQPAQSEHFGVRLQDEPADCSSGYGGPCSYVSGLMRGGTVIGASGWQNGYLPPGINVSAPSSGRSTSRLLHWLRDDSGRAAALEEAAQSAAQAGASAVSRNGLLCAADPVVESPFTHKAMPRGQAPSDSPSLHSWLGGNGHPHGSAGGAGPPGAAGGMAGAQELYCVAGPGGSGSSFCFGSELSKPESFAGMHGGAREQQPMAEYGGSRWSGAGPAPGAAQRQGVRAGALYPAAATEAESAPHNDGDSDLSSIMALINVR